MLHPEALSLYLEELPDPGPLWDPGPACEFCGCSEYDACPGGCGWSEYFLYRGQAVCTNCEAIAIAMEINFGALAIFMWRARNTEAAHAISD